MQIIGTVKDRFYAYSDFFLATSGHRLGQIKRGVSFWLSVSKREDMNSVTVFSWQLMKEFKVQFPAWQSWAVRVLLGEPGEGGRVPEGEMVLGWRPSRGPGSGGQSRGAWWKMGVHTEIVFCLSAPLHSTVSLKQFKSYILLLNFYLFSPHVLHSYWITYKPMNSCSFVLLPLYILN